MKSRKSNIKSSRKLGQEVDKQSPPAMRECGFYAKCSEKPEKDIKQELLRNSLAEWS